MTDPIAPAELVKVQLQVIEQHIGAVEREAKAERAGMLASLTQRLDDIDRANVILAENVNRVPTQLQVAVTTLKELEDVKFEAVRAAAIAAYQAINDRFELNDRQTAREKAAADLAVNAAFAAADKASAAAAAASTEAIRKSEAATTETIRTNAEVVRTGQVSTNDKIDDLKDRLVRAEAQIITLQTQRTTGQESKGDIRVLITTSVGILALFVAILVAAVTIYAALKP